jgi:hypothetical protein
MVLVLAPGCSFGPDRPEVGDTWEIEGVDMAGGNGTITIERGEIIAMPIAGPFVPPGSRAILVHISYEPARDSDTGYGPFDWGARPGDEEEGIGLVPRVLPLASEAEWPVEPHLGMKLPGTSDPVEGWVAVAVSPAQLADEIHLIYQPFLENGGTEASEITEILIYTP